MAEDEQILSDWESLLLLMLQSQSVFLPFPGNEMKNDDELLLNKVCSNVNYRTTVSHLSSSSTGCLISRHDQFLDTKLHMQGPQNDCCDGCGAVWVGDKFTLTKTMGIDLWDL